MNPDRPVMTDVARSSKREAPTAAALRELAASIPHASVVLLGSSGRATGQTRDGYALLEREEIEALADALDDRGRLLEMGQAAKDLRQAEWDEAAAEAGTPAMADAHSRRKDARRRLFTALDGLTAAGETHEA